MPIDYKRYPPNWKSEIRPRILERDGHKCKNCGLKNHIIGYRDNSGAFHEKERSNDRRVYIVEGDKVYQLYQILPNGYKLIQIILTIAHLDHDSGNYEVSDERLAALCQYCHLKMDRPQHIMKRKLARSEYRGAGTGQPTLF